MGLIIFIAFQISEFSAQALLLAYGKMFINFVGKGLNVIYKFNFRLVRGAIKGGVEY